MIFLLGANGFVGSAFARHFNQNAIDFIPIGRNNIAQFIGAACDILINAAANSKKYLSYNDPVADFDQSVAFILKTIYDFKYSRYLLVSSVDVYNNLSDSKQNAEDITIDPLLCSHYGFNKYIAELCVKKHTNQWLIIRLGGMVGLGLKKNPVYDILHDLPLRIHPESQYQYMCTDYVAKIVWQMICKESFNDIYNICGDGLITPSQISKIAKKILRVDLLSDNMEPRIVNINIDKISKKFPLQSTYHAITNYISSLHPK